MGMNPQGVLVQDYFDELSVRYDLGIVFVRVRLRGRISKLSVFQISHNLGQKEVIKSQCFPNSNSPHYPWGKGGGVKKIAKLSSSPS